VSFTKFGEVVNLHLILKLLGICLLSLRSWRLFFFFLRAFVRVRLILLRSFYILHKSLVLWQKEGC